MHEDFYFLDEGQVNITAASVGISKMRWACVNEIDIEKGEYIDLMKSNRFDHLPIIAKDGNVFEFFKSVRPNDFSKIERHKIKYDDVIPLDTNIRDVIEKFTLTERSFYFLSYHKNISGLITLGNLNCKQVQVYVFSLVCELERALSDFVNHLLNHDEIIEWINNKINVDNPNDKFKKIIDYYYKLVESDLENQITEHFYLLDFFNLIKSFKLYEKLNYELKDWMSLKSINELRNRIAHPTSSLLDNDNTIFKLKERLDKLNDLNFRLNEFQKQNP